MKLKHTNKKKLSKIEKMLEKIANLTLDIVDDTGSTLETASSIGENLHGILMDLNDVYLENERL